MKTTNTTTAPRPCETCQTKDAVQGERFCKACKQQYLAEMRAKHPPPERTGFSDQRGRKDGRSAHKLGGDSDMRDYINELDEQ